MEKAPSFYLTAIGAARVVGGPPGPAIPLLLVFHDHTGAEIAFEINRIVREVYPQAEVLQIASIVGLQDVPRFMRTAVQQILLAAYHHAATHIPENLDPSDFVVIVPDWDGKVTHAYDMHSLNHSRGAVPEIGLALIVNGWQLHSRYRGSEPASAALDMLAAAISREMDSTVAPRPLA